MKNLDIIIAGNTGTGKSTMMLMFEQFLIKEGFNVELDLTNEVDGDEIFLRSTLNKDLDLRKKALKESININIKTFQTSTSFF